MRTDRQTDRQTDALIAIIVNLDEYVLPELSDWRREVTGSAARDTGVAGGRVHGRVRPLAVVRPTVLRVPPVTARGPRKLGGHRRDEVVDRPRQYHDVEDIQPRRGDQRTITDAYTQVTVAVDQKKPALTRVQRPTPAMFLPRMTLAFDL